MNNQPFHCSDEQLLLHADRELPSQDSAWIRGHLEVCPDCRARAGKIASTLDSFVDTFSKSQLQSQAVVTDAAGSRARLKARLSEVARTAGVGRRKQLWLPYSLLGACAVLLLAVTGIALFRHPSGERFDGNVRSLPDPGITPGVTREVALADLCSSNGDEVVRSVSDSLREEVLHEYGIQNIPVNEFEVDYLITPGLGGAEDLRNLWPQPRFNTTWNSFVKDQLEDHLHHMVCERQISLSEAQRDIATNWIAAYKKYFRTEAPLANPLQARLSDPDHPRVALRRKQRAS